MPFDPTRLEFLSNAEVLALALSRPGRAVLLALEAIMLARIAARDAQPKRRQRKAKAPQTHSQRERATRRARKAAAKLAPQNLWGIEWANISNPMVCARMAALTARHGQPVMDGATAFFAGGTIAMSTVSAGVWNVSGDTFTLWPRDARDDLTNEGAPLFLAQMAREASDRAAKQAARERAIQAEQDARLAASYPAKRRQALAASHAWRAADDKPLTGGRGRRRFVWTAKAYAAGARREMIAVALHARRMFWQMKETA